MLASLPSLAKLAVAGVPLVWPANGLEGAGLEAAIVKGRAIAEEKCARCHAIGETDSSLHLEAPAFRDIVKRYPSENLAEALAEGIVSGHPDMPVFVLQPREIDAFLAYLDSLDR